MEYIISHQEVVNKGDSLCYGESRRYLPLESKADKDA